jgi:hypothetical protein
MHLEEVMVVGISHIFIHYKKQKFMGLIKAIIIQVFVGIFLTSPANMLSAMVGPVVLEGELSN